MYAIRSYYEKLLDDAEEILAHKRFSAGDADPQHVGAGELLDDATDFRCAQVAVPFAGGLHIAMPAVQVAAPGYRPMDAVQIWVVGTPIPLIRGEGPTFSAFRRNPFLDEFVSYNFV